MSSNLTGSLQLASGSRGETVLLKDGVAINPTETTLKAALYYLRKLEESPSPIEPDIEFLKAYTESAASQLEKGLKKGISLVAPLKDTENGSRLSEDGEIGETKEQSGTKEQEKAQEKTLAEKFAEMKAQAETQNEEK